MSIQHRDYTWHRREWEPENCRHFEPRIVRFVDAFGHEDDPYWEQREWQPI